MKILAFALHSALYTVAELAGRFVQMYGLLYLARVLTKEEYGQVGLLVAIQQFVTLMALAGVAEGVTARFHDHYTRKELPALYASSVRLGQASVVVVSVVYTIAAFFYARRVAPGADWSLAAALLASGLLSAFYNFLMNMFRLQEHHVWAVVSKVLPLVSCYAVALFAAWMAEDKVRGFFMGALFGLAVCLPSLAFKYFRSFGDVASADRGAVRALLRDSAPFVALTLFTWLAGYGNNVLIKALFTNEDVAEYTMVSNFGFLMLLATNAVSQVWSPRFFRIAAHTDRDRLNHLHGVVSQLQLYLAAVAAGGILIGYRDFLGLMKGGATQYVDALPYVGVVVASYVAFNLYYRSGNYFMLHNQGGVLVKLLIWSGIGGTIASLVFMWLVGKRGIYGGFLASILIRGLSVFIYARRKWGVALSWDELPVAALVVFAGYALASSWPFLWSVLAFGVVTVALLGFFALRNFDAIRPHLRLAGREG